MKVSPDKRLHLVYGSGVALFLLALLAAPLGIGTAVAAGSVCIGWGVERYQAIRHEGTADRMDWLASSLPGVLLGAGIEVAKVLF